MTRARITMAAVGAGLLVGLSVLAPTIASAKQATPPGMARGFLSVKMRHFTTPSRLP